MDAILKLDMPKDCKSCPLSARIENFEYQIIFTCVPIKERTFTDENYRHKNCPLKLI